MSREARPLTDLGDGLTIHQDILKAALDLNVRQTVGAISMAPELAQLAAELTKSRTSDLFKLGCLYPDYLATMLG